MKALTSEQFATELQNGIDAHFLDNIDPWLWRYWNSVCGHKATMEMLRERAEDFAKQNLHEYTSG